MKIEKKLDVLDWMKIHYLDRECLNKPEKKELDNFVNELKEAINYTHCSAQLKDAENDIVGNITSVGFTTPSNHGFLKIELPYSYYKIEKLSKGDKLKLLIV